MKLELRRMIARSIVGLFLLVAAYAACIWAGLPLPGTTPFRIPWVSKDIRRAARGCLALSARAEIVKAGDWPGESGATRSTAEPPQLVVVGIDGATWHLALPLINEDKLPNLRRILEEGASGDVSCSFSSTSPLIWTSIYTGREPRDHGIEGFFIRPHADSQSTPAMSNLRKVKALWNIASDAGRNVGVVGGWATYPAEEIRGVVLSMTLIERYSAGGDIVSDPDLAYPRSIAQRLATGLPRRKFEALVSDCARALGDFDADPRLLSRNLKANIQSCREYLGSDLLSQIAALQILETRQPDLLLVYFRGLDAVSHVFWNFMEPWGWPQKKHVRYPSTPSSRDLFKEIIPRYYQLVDAFLGQLMEKSAPGTVFLLCADHGFSLSLDKQMYEINKLLEIVGFLKFKPDGSVDEAATLVYDEGVMGWIPKRTLLYGDKGDREERGNVVEALDALRTIKGKRVFSIVKFEEPEAHCITATFNPSLSDLDEVIIDGKAVPVSRFATAIHWTGNHEPEGVLAAMGPAIRKGAIIEESSVLDIAPTALVLLGIPVSREMPGKALLPMLREDFLSRFPPETVLSHEVAGKPPEEKQRDIKGLHEELRGKLKALGYIQ